MIELKDVSFSYAEDPVLCGLSLYFQSPGAYAVWGPSGCGKTTLMLLLAGLLKPTRGEVTRKQGLRTAICFQEDRLMPWLTVLDNVSLTLPAEKKRARRALGMQWLDRVGLADAADCYPSELSGGMKRRVALARALAYNGDILLLDEPFRALDEALHAQMLALVRDHAREKLLILVTHDPEDAQGMQRIDLKTV